MNVFVAWTHKPIQALKEQRVAVIDPPLHTVSTEPSPDKIHSSGSVQKMHSNV